VSGGAPEVKYCAECGTRLARTAKFCVNCGARQEGPPEAPAAAPEAPAAAAEAPAAAPEAPAAAPEAPAASASEVEAPAAEAPAPEPEPEPTPQPEPEPPPPEPEPEPAPATAGAGAAGAAAASPRVPLRERVGRIDPEAGELVGQMAAGLALPAVAAATAAALIAALATLAAGLVLALVFPDGSLIGAVGQGTGVISETFRQVPQLVSASVFSTGLFQTGPTRAAPIILVAVPIAACALAARAQRGRIEDVTGPWRLAWAAGVGLAFALLLVILTLFGGEGDGVEPSLGSVLGLGFLWGTTGALIGAPPKPAERRDPRLDAALEVTAAALRPLAAVLAVCALIGLWAWLIQTGRDVSNVQGSRSEALALVENGLYVGEHGIHFAELGALAQFGQPGLGALGLPYPVDRPNDVAAPGEDFRLFAYRDAVPTYVFVPAMLVLIAIIVLAAVYAGFLVARRRRPPAPGQAAAWGALVGPIWAVVVGILSALASKKLFGDPQGDSVFATFLLGGALLGALGGVLAARAGGNPHHK
jgi:hypothetical protein